MNFRIVKALVVIFTVNSVWPHYSYAGDMSSALRDIVGNIKEVCAAPGRSGQRWDIKSSGSADAKVRVKMLGVIGLNGDIEFSKQE